MAGVRASTVVGMAVMDYVGRSGSVMLHDVPANEREQIVASLVEKGWEPYNHPENNDMRGARDPETSAYIAMWCPRG